MTECTPNRDLFPACKSRKIEVSFDGGHISSDGGSLLLRQMDRKLGLTRKIDKVLFDPRRQASCSHSQLTMLRQRIYSLALGYEDLNDQDTLRCDPVLQTAVESDKQLASSPTLCRLENRAEREVAVAISSELVAQFIASHDSPPKELVLDFDATDDIIHGMQQGRFFHGYYDHYCFLPLYVFCGSQLLVAYLRRSNIDAARHSWAILSLLVKRLRQQWPEVNIIFRADSGFCRWRMLRWCDKHDVHYIIGLAKNQRINVLGAELIREAQSAFESTGEKQRLFSETMYGAGTWDRPRRVIIKAEYNAMGSNPRYVVTNLIGDPQQLYDNLYCARGNMENRIKEQQLDLFSDRTSCQRWWPNQFRVLLSALAYVLVEAIRRLALKGTEMQQSQCASIRLKLFKIGAIIQRNTRRVRIHLSSAYPYQELFWLIAKRLAIE
jgi:hypothetical protein